MKALHTLNLFLIAILVAVLLGQQFVTPVHATTNPIVEEPDFSSYDMPLTTKVTVYEPEQYAEIPLMNQRDYPKTAYGKYGTIYSHGCGLVSIAMVATYLTDEYHDPVELADKFGNYNTQKGSMWILIKDSAEKLGLDLIASDCPNGEWYNWNKVMAALRNGQPVICLQKSGLFTRSGHYIVLTGLTDDGKIMVNDPNGFNWNKNKTMINGYKNGFTEQQIRQGATAYWIYAKKELTPSSYYTFNYFPSWGPIGLLKPNM